jgi:anti-sigma B factor antagonist/stage II sporulation protein AA (anti-sigma F factor antagonist)
VAVTRTARNCLLLEFTGELDIASARQLERKLFLPRRADMDLDLSGLSFVDATGIRFLVMVARKRGGKAIVVAYSPAARRVLEITGLGRLIPVAESRRAAGEAGDVSG